MPAYNAAQTIERSLASALDQTAPATEIIVVDDGSTDDTPAIVQAMAQAHPALRLIQQANAGPMAARNRAIAESEGDLIAPLDADDLWRPSYLEAMTAAFTARPDAGFAYANHRVIDGDDTIVRDGLNVAVEGWSYLRHLLVNFVGNGSCAVFRRDALLAAGGYDLATQGWGGAEDYLLQLRIAAHHPVAHVPLALVGYRQVGGSYSSNVEAMSTARINAVQQALSEQGVEGGERLERWNRSGALRVLAVQKLAAGQVAQAILPATTALALDPVATLSETTARASNAIRRLGGGAGPARTLRLDAIAADQPFIRSVDRVLELRLANLRASEPRST